MLFDCVTYKEIARPNLSTEMWDPTRLSLIEVDDYILQIKRIWPYDNYPYKEEIALQFLCNFEYDTQSAILHAMFDKQSIIDLSAKWNHKIKKIVFTYNTSKQATEELKEDCLYLKSLQSYQ